MSELRARVEALEALFRHVERTRMAGVPVLNRALCVEAVGFEPVAVDAGEAPAVAGVLLTPWFMNLVWLPMQPAAGEGRVGQTRVRSLGGPTCFEFIAAHEPGFGAYEACSLASPMFDYNDQAQASATAVAVLAELRPAKVVSNARRGFLFGRNAAEARP
ncbi:[NiFe]-hydrogenase assembly chaperone HybE [Roseateles saccharophilus]|uniref:[NiFe] hydrogenase assembly HybE family chaperone n=1 Tax=Roseateles saccharophilus TaxID=304 RepID=A0A4R3USZ4_ROSSA|nr:[NiFe]-hydrogenase assembly chaperone HybE [Roseateles saccharophilus]MDG0833322.1 [NiFe]-hydrogenase assembly, chaperone, HybE [Roseateles saccharophilus]TCU93773.1 [NiFe] hydrogenase assembly HybE family chaperone [Roseateles saccharophilus]